VIFSDETQARPYRQRTLGQRCRVDTNLEIEPGIEKRLLKVDKIVQALFDKLMIILI
jgi:hypothetical protein